MRLFIAGLVAVLGSVCVAVGAPGHDPLPRCGTPDLSDPSFLQKAIERTRTFAPDVYRAMTEQTLRKPAAAAADTIGSQKIFFVYNFKTAKYEQVNANLLSIGRITKIWVDVGELRLQHVTQTEVDEIRTTLEDSSPSTSRNPQEGVVELDQQFFGKPPDINSSGVVDAGDGKTTFLITDIQDGWDSTSTAGYVAGFFSSNDQIVNNPGSNRCDMLYIDSYPGIYYRGVRNPQKPLDVLAHEYQHLIHYRYDQSEQTWVNEGLSEYAEVVAGFLLRDPASYFADANVPLSRWSSNSSPDVLDDYARVALFTLYSQEQNGDDYIRSLVQNPLHGIEGINDAARASGAPYGFADLFQNWLCANILNDRAIDPRYGYRYPVAGRATVNNTDVTNPNISAANLVVQTLAVHYIEFAYADSLHITFSRQSGYLTPGVKVIETGVGTTGISDVGLGIRNAFPEFGTKYSMLIFVLSNPSPSQQFVYSYSATGLQSYVLTELKYDDGTPVPFSGSVSLFGFGNGKAGYGMAEMFQPANSLNSLIGAKLYLAFDNELTGSPYPSNSQKTFTFHVWGDSGGFPGRDLLPPVSESVERADFTDDFTIVRLDRFRSALTDLAGPVYLGFTQSAADSTGIYAGTSNTTTTNYSFAFYGPASQTNPNNWVPFSSVHASNGASLAGFNAMFRAIFLYKQKESGIGSGSLNSVLQNYPNPFTLSGFNSVTHIPYHAAGNAEVILKIYNVLGRVVATLTSIAPAEGSDEFVWDGTSDAGVRLASGIYFYRITSQGGSETRKLVLIK